jgi:hypothetical protein
LAWVEVFRDGKDATAKSRSEYIYFGFGLVRGYGKRFNRLMPSELHKIYGAHW